MKEVDSQFGSGSHGHGNGLDQGRSPYSSHHRGGGGYRDRDGDRPRGGRDGGRGGRGDRDRDYRVSGGYVRVEAAMDLTRHNLSLRRSRSDLVVKKLGAERSL